MRYDGRMKFNQKISFLRRHTAPMLLLRAAVFSHINFASIIHLFLRFRMSFEIENWFAGEFIFCFSIYLHRRRLRLQLHLRLRRLSMIEILSGNFSNRNCNLTRLSFRVVNLLKRSIFHFCSENKSRIATRMAGREETHRVHLKIQKTISFRFNARHFNGIPS